MNKWLKKRKKMEEERLKVKNKWMKDNKNFRGEKPFNLKTEEQMI